MPTVQELLATIEGCDKALKFLDEKRAADEKAFKMRALERRPHLLAMEAAPRDAQKWLWPGRVPMGSVTLLAGPQDAGKSLLTLDWAARVSRGSAWPDDELGWAPGRSLLLTGEDSVATVHRRLAAAGADLARIACVPWVQVGESGGEPFALDRDAAALRRIVDQHRDLRLVVLDPLGSFTGRWSPHDPRQGRRIVEQLELLVAGRDSALVAVTHLVKSERTSGLNRTLGTVSITAAARAVHRVLPDPSDPARSLLIPVKSNLAEKPKGLAYRIVKNEEGEPRVEWDKVPVVGRIDDLRAINRESLSPESERACDFLMEQLSIGERTTADLLDRAKSAGIAEWRLREVKQKVGARIYRRGFGPGAYYVWRLPACLQRSGLGEAGAGVGEGRTEPESSVL